MSSVKIKLPNNPLWVFSLLRITAVIILHPSNRHFGILQVVLKFVLGHHGVILAAVPKGDIQFAVLGINGLLLKAFAEAILM